MANLKVEEVRASKEAAKEMQIAANMGILTVDTDGQTRPPREQEEVNWHELTNAFRTRKVLSGMLGGIEKLEVSFEAGEDEEHRCIAMNVVLAE